MSKLCKVLSDPCSLNRLSEQEWDRLIPLARYAKLLGTLNLLTEQQNCLPPAQATNLLRSESTRVSFIQCKINFELQQIADALADHIDSPPILLKGSAYLLANLPPHEGRRFNDVDLLVRKGAVDRVEKRLITTGWKSDPELTAYDRHYYRAWMHEIPPLKHPARGIEVDLHHNLTPPVSRLKIPADRLFDSAIQIPGSSFYRLCDEDLFLHSAVHLLFNDELRGGLRDLWDLHLLANHCQRNRKNWWQDLSHRASELGLLPAMDLALLLLKQLLSTSIDVDLLKEVEDRCKNPGTQLTLYFAKQALAPQCREKLPPKLALNYLYIRSHWIRMPAGLLLRHLLTKFIQSHWRH